MASSPGYHFESIQLLSERITACANSLSLAPGSHPSFATHAQPLQALKQQLLSHLQSHISQHNWQRPVVFADNAFVLTFARAVLALVQQLNRFDASLLEHNIHEATVFNALWECLHAACLAFTQFWPFCTGMDLTGFYSALHCMMLWVLSFVRSGYHQPDVRHNGTKCAELAAIMQLPLIGFTHIGSAPAIHVLRMLAALPDGYLQLLCCISCEMFGSFDRQDNKHLSKQALEATAYAIKTVSSSAMTGIRSPQPGSACPPVFAALTSLVHSIVNCSSFALTDERLTAAFTSPAVIEVCKRVIIMFGPQLGVAGLPFGRSCCAVLHQLISTDVHIMAERKASGQLFVPAQDSHQGPDMVPIEHFVDMRFLQLLGERACADESTACITFRLMGAVLQSWQLTEGGAAVVGSLKLGRSLSVINLAHQCVMHTHNWMRAVHGQRGETIQQRNQRRKHQQKKQGRQRRGQSDPQGCFGESTMQHLQRVMGLVCAFNMQAQASSTQRPQGLTLSNICERLAGHRELNSAWRMHTTQDPGILSPAGPALHAETSLPSKSLQDTLIEHSIFTLNAWSQLPGCIRMLESLSRDMHQPRSTDEVCQAVKLIASMMSTESLLEPGSLPAYINLAATARKLLHIQTHRPVKGCVTNGHTGLSPQTGVCANAHRDYHSAPNLPLTTHQASVFKALGTSITSIGLVLQQSCNLQGEGTNGSSEISDLSRSCGAAITSLVSSSTGNSTVAYKLEGAASTIGRAQVSSIKEQEGVMGIAPVGRGLACDSSCYIAPTSHTLLHQLQAIQVCSLIDLCHYMAHYKAGEGRVAPTVEEFHAWLADVVRTLRAAVSTDLAEVADSLLSLAAMMHPGAQQNIHVVLGRYAVTQFHGRLVPGCCYLGCTNLDGVSEAALGTQLCSGCRRARYCSLQCQKAAWREGGHSFVCAV